MSDTNKKEFELALTKIVEALRVIAGEHGQTAVQLFSDGQCVLIDRPLFRADLSVEQLAEKLASMTASGGKGT